MTSLKKMVTNYKTEFLGNDISAGLSVAAIALPQNMAYALILGLNPIYGLYTSIVSMFVAFFVGVSNYMIVGPANIIAVAIASSLSFLDESNYFNGVLLLTFMIGIIQVLLGFLKIDKLVNYVSQSVVAGLTTGIALLIGADQLINFFGLPVERGSNLFYTLYKVIENIDKLNYYSVILGLITIILVLTFKKINSRLPSYLLSLAISTLVVCLFNFENRLQVVETVSFSLPTFEMIDFNVKMVDQLFVPALSISILGFIQVVSIVKGLEKTSRQEVNLNKEFIGQGIINIICSQFNSFAISGSFTNSFANFKAGAKTRFSELVTAVTILLFLIFCTPIISYIPISSLAAIVIFVACLMIDKEEIIQNFKTTRFDAAVFLTTFLMTISSPRLDFAIYFGVLVSIILVLKDTSDINYSHIKYDRNNKHDFYKKDYENVKDDDFIVINLAGTLHFHSSENLKKEFNRSFKERKVFVIRMREIDHIDMTVIRELDKFIDKVQENQGEVILSGLIDKIYKSLEEYGIIDKINEENVFFGDDYLFSSTRDAIEKAEDKVKKMN